MKAREAATLNITFTSASAAGTTVAASTFKSLELRRCDIIVVDAILLGATGGTLDVYLQRRTGPDDWTDWAHFAQVVAAGSSRQTFSIDGAPQQPVVVGGGTTAAPGVALAAGVSVNIMPANNKPAPLTADATPVLDEVRIVTVAGAGTSAGAVQSITMTFYNQRH